jgi:uncharacterized protein YeaO (DUF488 family)
MKIHNPARRGDSLRIGTTRRPPRGVPRNRWQADGYFDVWFPVVAPRLALFRRFRGRNLNDAAVLRVIFEAVGSMPGSGGQALGLSRRGAPVMHLSR